jgi:hypothetical protein
MFNFHQQAICEFISKHLRHLLSTESFSLLLTISHSQFRNCSVEPSAITQSQQVTIPVHQSDLISIASFRWDSCYSLTFHIPIQCDSFPHQQQPDEPSREGEQQQNQLNINIGDARPRCKQVVLLFSEGLAIAVPSYSYLPSVV